MNCTICKTGYTHPGTEMVTFDVGSTVLVYRDVPAQICENCGEAYLDSAVTEKLLEAVRTAQTSGVEVAIHHFAA